MSMLIAVLIVRLFSKFDMSPIVLAVLMLMFGCVRYNISSQNSLFKSFPEKYVEINGIVCSLPKASQSQYKYRYEVRLNSVSYLGNTYKTSANILLNSKKELSYGENITAWGFLTDFSESSNEFEFNYSLYYKSRGILSRLTALELLRNGTEKHPSPAFLAGRLKERIYRNMQSTLPHDSFAFANAVIFGDRSQFDKGYSNLLLRTGIFRILYSPFSHLSVMLIFAALIFTKKKRQNILFLIMLALYLIFINNSPVALKAGIVAAAVLISTKFKGYADKLGIVSAAALLLTLINPLLCFDGGFMMSVISSVLLCLSFRPIKKFLSRSRLIRKLHIAAPLSLWIVISVGTLPFAAYYFNGISPYSMLLIPFVLPFVMVIIFLTPFMFIAKSGLTTLLLPVYNLTIMILRLFPAFVSRLPFYYIMLPHPSAIAIISYSLLWWLFIRTIQGKFRTFQSRLILAAFLGLFVCIALDLNINSLNLYFVNVGQGDAAVLHTSRGETVLIDGGGASDYNNSYNIGESVFLPYLVSHGFTRIDVAVVSHYHKDHAEGIVAAAENLKINTLIMPDCMPKNKFRVKLEEIAKARHIKVEYLGVGDEIRFRSGLNLSVIAPEAGLTDLENENDTSLVINVRYGDFSALFTGDFEAEEDMTMTPQNIDLLKVGHHGSKDANDFEFLSATNPRIAVISVGKGNRYCLPSKDVIENLESLGSTVLRTDLLGDVRIKVSKNGNMLLSVPLRADG
ncbi:MAG: DNA internalization-related competence protein ComEC/Rec2, partial [Clostridia bacterium]|nr:DNA internalization-related competence protein ComEC/Rec2 [Clostridia bacterium]